ncbi:hypothetical protein D3C76_1863520 [compost metagenome]
MQLAEDAVRGERFLAMHDPQSDQEDAPVRKGRGDPGADAAETRKAAVPKNKQIPGAYV